MEYLLYIFLGFIFILIVLIMKEAENFINKKTPEFWHLIKKE